MTRWSYTVISHHGRVGAARRYARYDAVMDYKEEREFVIRLRLSATFAEDYQGEDDGFAWHERFDKRVRPELVRELARILTDKGHFKITPVNRGIDAHEELEMLVEHVP